MVSFQCDTCTDVVKKPKLDRHYGQCRSSFTCIDCSKTFPGPAEWKAHTSCVTEAEKYQKSLYKGPKKGQRPGNGHQKNPQPDTVNAPGKYNQSRNNQSGWSRHQYIPNRASGANSTPLGSPRRMSPVDPSVVEPSPSTMANAPAKIESGVGKKRDLAADHMSNGSEPKEKKREKKHDPPRGQTGKDAAADEATNSVIESFKKEPSNVKRSSEKQKTSKSGEHDVSQSPTEGVKVKKRKKEKGEEVQLKQGEQPIATNADDGKKRKRKHKEKREDAEGDTAEEAAEKERTGVVEDKKRKKKRKLTSEELAAPSTM